MLTIKKSSFLFRLWYAIQRSMPGVLREPNLIEKRLKTMTLCRFFWDIPTNMSIIVVAHMTVGVLGLVFAPFAWNTGIFGTLGAILLGFYPAGGCDRVRKMLQEIKKDEAFVSRPSEHFLMWTVMAPLTFIFLEKDSTPYRRYRTINIFGRPIYPYHLLVPALLYWLASMGVRLAQASPAFAQGVVNVASGIGLFITAAAVIFLLVCLSKSESGKLIRAYLRAKKQRVCPRVTFTDD